MNADEITWVEDIECRLGSVVPVRDGLDMGYRQMKVNHY
jgi:hypothetical protein